MQRQLELGFGLLDRRRRHRTLCRRSGSHLLLLLCALFLAASAEEDLVISALLLDGDKRLVLCDRPRLTRLDAIDRLLLLKRASSRRCRAVASQVVDNRLAVLNLRLVGWRLGLFTQLGRNLEPLGVLGGLAVSLELVGLAGALPAKQ